MAVNFRCVEEGNSAVACPHVSARRRFLVDAGPEREADANAFS